MNNKSKSAEWEGFLTAVTGIFIRQSNFVYQRYQVNREERTSCFDLTLSTDKLYHFWCFAGIATKTQLNSFQLMQSKLAQPISQWVYDEIKNWFRKKEDRDCTLHLHPNLLKMPNYGIGKQCSLKISMSLAQFTVKMVSFYCQWVFLPSDPNFIETEKPWTIFEKNVSRYFFGSKNYPVFCFSYFTVFLTFKFYLPPRKSNSPWF